MEIRPTTGSSPTGLVTGESPPATASAQAVSGASSSAPPPEVDKSATTQAAQTPAPTVAQVKDAVNEINKSMQTMAQGLIFTVDTDSHRTVVKVIDQKTNQVIRQIPSKVTLDIAQSLDHWQGLLIKEKA